MILFKVQYMLKDKGIWVRFTAGGRDDSFSQSAQTGPGLTQSRRQCVPLHLARRQSGRYVT